MQEFWDSQFKFSEILADFGGAVARMGQDSAKAAEHLDLTRVAYGDHPRHWLEWTPGQGPQSVLPVIIHGEYWRALEAEAHRFLIPGFEVAGARVANVEYRLMPEVRLAEVVADVVAALRMLADLFPDAKFVLVGHSAGAHLALTAMRETDLASRTMGVLALSGVYDLAPVRLSFLQSELRLTTDEVAALSLCPNEQRPPVLYVNGSAETPEFLRGGALMSQPNTAEWHLIEGADHMSLTWAVRDQADQLLTKLYSLGNKT